MSAIYRSFARVGELAPPTVAAIRGGAVGAGLNLALATDLRVVGEDAKLLSGFIPIGLHPGGGHTALLGRLGSREAAAALTLFGERLTGAQAVERGLAWSAVPDAEVDAAALALAAVPAKDPELARRTAASLRTVTGPPALPWNAALELERASQMWSMRRKAELTRTALAAQEPRNAFDVPGGADVGSPRAPARARAAPDRPAAASPREPEPLPAEATVLGLQRTAGNRAVSSLLARQPRPGQRKPSTSTLGLGDESA